jgi:hypothetical protein
MLLQTLQTYFTSPLGNNIITWVQANPFLFTGLFVIFFAIGLAVTMPKR